MDQDTKPTYEELEQTLWRHERWSWKRALLALGFGSILPILVATIFLVWIRHDSAPSMSAKAHDWAYEKARQMPATGVSHDGEAARVDADLAIVDMKRQYEAERKAVAARGVGGVLSHTIKAEAPKGQPAPNTSEAILGLLAISAFGLGLLAFRKREVHAGWGISAAAGIILGAVLTLKAVDAGSFLAFDAFLSLKPSELLSLSVGHLGMILITLASGVLGLLQVPDLLHAILTLIGTILTGIGRGIGHAASAYGSFCWFLACKAAC
jgi:hypothetical protein